MRKGVRALTLGTVLMWLFAVAVSAQGAGRVTINAIDTAAHPAMSVLLSVQDANGVPIPNLEAGQFELVEDGRTSFPPAQIATQINPEAVTAIALVVDLSGSMKGKPLDEAKTASANLLDALLDKANDPDRAAFFGINRPVSPTDLTLDESVEVAFGNDKNKILNVVNFLSVDGNRSTPLFDALYRVIKITSEQAGQRAIIVITDGIDKVSKFKADDVINEANRNQIPVFPISLSTNTVDETFLERLAVRTGGEYRKAPAPEEFTSLFQQVLDQMKLEYKLSYQSRLPLDGNPHSLLISVRAPRVQGFAEKKFQLGAAAAATSAPNPADATPASTTSPATPAPGGAPAATATPVSGGTVIDDLTTFIQDNPLPAALIGVAALLLIALLVLLVVWLRRRSAPVEAPLDYSLDAGGSDWQAQPPAPVSGGGMGAATGAGGFSGGVPTVGPGNVGGNAATVGPGAPATSAPTVGPGGGPGFAPAPAFGGVPQPPKPPGGAAAGSTMILDRTPKPKHSALLIERRDPTKRHDLRVETDIGRTQTNAVVLADATVSRQHARIRLQDDQFMLFDLGSANGTFVNGQKVEQPRPLTDGDVVRFGEVEMVFKQLT